MVATPFFYYSPARDAYVLRAVGNRYGPVLRLERRRSRAGRYAGDERRGAHAFAGF